MPSDREPIFNLPAAIVFLIGAFAAVHIVREFLLTEEQDVEFLVLFAFIPARYETTLLAGGSVPGGLGADLWTLVSYSFIHADLTHILINSVWLLPFGSAVARRFGAARFFAFFALTSAAGALAHFATHPGSLVPVIGASAAISGCMAAAMRFVFQAGGPLGLFRRTDRGAYLVPALSLGQALRDPRVVAFLVVWFALNLLFGLGSLSLAGGQQVVAWEAHIGGFLAGLLAFPIFDPAPRQSKP